MIDGKGRVVFTPTARRNAQGGFDFDEGEEVPFEVETNPDLGVDVDIKDALFTRVVDIELPEDEEQLPEGEGDSPAWGTLPDPE
jgi:hypothetical protein